MPKTKRLHFKDLDALRFFGFIPVFLFSVLFLSATDTEGFHHEMLLVISYLKINSFDFFFFISSFLLTSQGLREYKYNQNFALKSFYVRRFIRLLPLSVVALSFAFIAYPLIIKTLKLNVVTTPQGPKLLQLIPEYYASYINEQYIYLAVIWVILMFAIFYVIWGLILKYGSKALKSISILFILAGIASRITCHFLDISFEFNPLAYGVPIGMAAILAQLVRTESKHLEKIKNIPKKFILPIYILGLAIVVFGYLMSTNFFIYSIVPVITSSYFGFLILDQTFGKNSPFKFRNNKVLTHLGKISFGLFVYQAILNVLIVIGIDSLDFEMTSFSTKILFTLLGFVMSWIVADLSFNFVEKPLLRMRREFKKI
jgi:peptidoglycan/LPS O-acetylase OafA/YrhL